MSGHHWFWDVHAQSELVAGGCRNTYECRLCGARARHVVSMDMASEDSKPDRHLLVNGFSCEERVAREVHDS